MLAAFDFDHTLVKPKDARTFPKNATDWQWLRPSVPNVLAELHSNGYDIVVFTNQTKEWKLDMIRNALETLHLPVLVVIGFTPDLKKPNRDLFYQVAELHTFNVESSFYVGDAYGGSAWSDDDIQFAANVGIQFRKPEEVFPVLMDICTDNTIDYSINHQEIAIMVGFPASGKSTFVKNKLPTHVHISGDVLKTMPKMIQAAKVALTHGSVVFDATNGKAENRAAILALATQLGLPIRCFVMQTTMERAMEFNEHRSLDGTKKVPKIAYYTYRKYYEPPTPADNVEVINIYI